MASERNTIPEPAKIEEVFAKEPTLLFFEDPESKDLSRKIEQMKHNLRSILTTMQQGKSLFAHVANFWGTLPGSRKIVGGVVLFVPAFLVGIVAHVSALLTASVLTTIVYVSSSFILDDHHRWSNKNRMGLEKSILSLANMLGDIILAFGTYCSKLALETGKFRAENKKLTQNNQDLGGRVNDLTIQITQFSATEQLLEKTEDRLKATTHQLEQTVEASQQERIQMQRDYEIKFKKLNETIAELTSVKTSMELDIEKAKKIVATLKGAIETLSETVIVDEVHRVDFQKKLNEFLTNSQASFDTIAERICKAESELVNVKQELVVVKEELQHANAHYNTLLTNQERQIRRMERLVSGLSAPYEKHRVITPFFDSKSGSLSRGRRCRSNDRIYSSILTEPNLLIRI